ncbi:MAG TPA: helix-turn-helix domain-containing protein [Thermoplasmata archaeon]|nr:helix-turn-helix domain-containing protein [Thermoplasmata archaeon]
MSADGGTAAEAPAAAAPGNRKERVLDALGDPAAREILMMLNDAPMSAQEMLASNRIPQSTLYRKLHDLQQIGLVGVQRTAITPEGKRVDLYRSLLERLAVELYGRTLRIDVKYRDLATERLQTMWKNYRREASP